MAGNIAVPVLPPVGLQAPSKRRASKRAVRSVLLRIGFAGQRAASGTSSAASGTSSAASGTSSAASGTSGAASGTSGVASDTITRFPARR